MPDRAFDFKKFIAYVIARKLIDYRTLFWRVMSWSLVLKCCDCDEWFQGVHYFDCKYHPNRPIFLMSNINEGHYPCCRKKALKFDTNLRIKGCMQK